VSGSVSLAGPQTCRHTRLLANSSIFAAGGVIIIIITIIAPHFGLSGSSRHRPRCLTAHGPPRSCQPRATRRDRDPSLPQLRVHSCGCCPQPCVTEIREAPGAGAVGSAATRQPCPPVTGAVCPTGLPRCGRRCPRSGGRSTRCTSSPPFTASPSTSWMRMRSGTGRWWGLGGWSLWLPACSTP